MSWGIMGHRLQHIRHPSQLSALSVWRMIRWQAPDRVLIEAEDTPAERTRLWEKQLGHLQSACGCEQGAAGLIVGAIGYALFLFLRPGGWGHPGRREFWIGLAVLMTTTSVGKFLGLLLAQRRLKRVIGEIQTHWKPRPLQAPQSEATGLRQTDGRVRQTRCCGGRSAEPLLQPGGRRGV